MGAALVRNHAKLAYNGVAAWFDGAAPAPAQIEPGLQEQLRLQDRVAQTLKTRPMGADHPSRGLTRRTGRKFRGMLLVGALSPSDSCPPDFLCPPSQG